MKRRKPLNVRELNRRALAGEQLRLHKHDEIVRAHLELLLEDWRLSLPLSEDDRDVLMSVAEDHVLHTPLPPGRPRKSQKARDQFAHAITDARLYRAALIRQGKKRKEATNLTVAMLKEKHHSLFSRKKEKTIIDRLNRCRTK